MAEIPIERKRRNPLPWILGLLALLVVLFLIMRSRGDGARDTGQDGGVTAPTSTAPGATTTP